MVAPAHELRVSLTHLLGEHRHQFVEERLLHAELVAVADRAPHDPPQHVAATFVGRQHAVDHQEGARADVIRDHAQRARGEHRGPGEPARLADQVLEQIDVVVGMHALHHGRDALESHAGVHRRLRQRGELAVRGALELHEHQVPDLDEPVSLLLGGPRRAAGNPGAVVVEDLAARPARAGIAHGPEVRRLAEPCEALRADADVLQPDVRRLIIVAVHRAPQPRGIEPERAGEELPREMDRLALEILAEREVAEHLEESVVARGIAHVLEIVVFAAGPHAALARGGAQVVAPFPAEKHVLELHHAGVGKEKGRVVAGHERARGHDHVAERAEKVEKRAAHLRGAHVRRLVQRDLSPYPARRP